MVFGFPASGIRDWVAQKFRYSRRGISLRPNARRFRNSRNGIRSWEIPKANRDGGLVRLTHGRGRCAMWSVVTLSTGTRGFFAAPTSPFV
jgi:hypothetical protein